MAEVLKEFNFDRASKGTKYLPYFDGQIWKLSPSEFDLDDDVKGLAGRIRSAATKAGKALSVRVTMDGHLVVQAVDRSLKPLRNKRKPATEPASIGA